MKKLMIVFAAVAASMLLVCGHASAIAITPFQLYTPWGTPQNPVSITDAEINELDWLPGTGLAVDANAQEVGGFSNPFEMLYQLKLGSIIDVNWETVSDPTMNGTVGNSLTPTPYEFTAVGRMWELATDLGGWASDFSLVPGTVAKPNMIEIWADKYDAAQNTATETWGTKADVTTGTGFRDGVLIMEATPIHLDAIFDVTENNANGIPDNQDVGTGSTMVIYRVDSYDPNYWSFPDPANPNDPTLLQMQFDGTLTMPPAGVHTPNMWDGTATDYFTPLVAGTTPQNTNNLMFKFDGNSHFQPIPEPATMFLLGSGLVGLAGFARKKRKKVS